MIGDALETIDPPGRNDVDDHMRETTGLTHAVDGDLGNSRCRMPWPGATIGHGLIVSTSNIPGAGRGLFAAMDFIKGDVITIYDGEHIDKGEACRRKVKTHMASICSQCVIDGLKEPIHGRGGGSFVNDPQTRMMRNAEFRRVDEGYKCNYGVNLVAIRPIFSGDEIYASYGSRGFAYAMPEE